MPTLNKGRISLLYLTIVVAYGLLMLAQESNWLGLGTPILIPLRVFVLLIFGYLVVKKKSLTAWILYSMFIGTEIGYDAPEIAVHLQVLSKIFLRLIKTIIAPLIFSTLVVGIAGHASLKHCLLYTSDAADERSSVDLGGRRIIKKKKYIRSEIDLHLQKKVKEKITRGR